MKKISFSSRILISILMLATTLMLSCTINQKRRFEKVQVGMEKNEILELMSSPQRRDRWRGLDRWTYIFYENDEKFEKEIHFSNGISTYVGDPYQPATSAEARDQMIEQKNAELDQQERKNKSEQRVQFEKFEKSIKGDASSPAYVPQFKPID